MKIKRIIWLDEIIEKLIRKHNVSQIEVREVLNNKPHLGLLKKDIIQKKMFMQQWDRIIVGVTLLYFLYTKRIEAPLFYQHAI